MILGVPRSAVTPTRGQVNKRKLLEVAGVAPAEAAHCPLPPA